MSLSFFNCAAISPSVYIAAMSARRYNFCCGEIACNLRIFCGKNARNVVPVASKTCILQAVAIYVIYPSRRCASLRVYAEERVLKKLNLAGLN
jgi:hypothetical protein